MTRSYFEPENLQALEEVLTEVKRRLTPQDLNDPTKLDAIALRILALAAEGTSPWMILREFGLQAQEPIQQESAHAQSEESTFEGRE